MADADEDTIRATPETQDQDPTEETQDFRFLGNLSINTGQLSLPRRGEKDFEPHGTLVQRDVLDASRAAMREALSFTRFHTPKSRICAVLDDPAKGAVSVARPRGQHFRVMGTADATGTLRLLPEEALYLVERGSLDLQFADGSSGDGVVAAGWEGLSLSLQSAYTMLLGKQGLSLELYLVYAGLRRFGYIVQRSPDWSGLMTTSSTGPSRQPRSSSSPSPKLWLFPYLSGWRSRPPDLDTALIGTGFYRNYASVYAALSKTPCHDPRLIPEPDEPSNKNAKTNRTAAAEGVASPMLHCSFHVWKPRPDYKKSKPGEPDFRIAVVDAARDTVPDLSSIDAVLQSLPIDPPPAKMSTQTFQKLKHGCKNFIFAVVDQGIVSYIRLADASFGLEPLHKQAKNTRRGKGKNFQGKGQAASKK